MRDLLLLGLAITLAVLASGCVGQPPASPNETAGNETAPINETVGNETASVAAQQTGKCGFSCPEGYWLKEETCACLPLSEKPADEPKTPHVSCYPYPCTGEDRWAYREDGIVGMEWVSDNTLEIHANAMANCALGVNEAGALVNGTNITIFYEVAAAEPGQPLLACVCGNEVICTIEDLEKQEYNISIKELR